MAEHKHATQPDKPKDTEEDVLREQYTSLEMTGYMLKYKLRTINTI